MTKAIQKLIEWQAGDPKRRGWSIHQFGEIVRIQMRSEPFRCDQDVTTRTVQQAKCDVLEVEVEQAIVKLDIASRDGHGRTCKKVWHKSQSPTYKHESGDDGPYDVDGVAYCGRCHESI